MLLVLVSHGLCLGVQPHPSLRTAVTAHTCSLRRRGGAVLSAQAAADGPMTDDLEVWDVGMGGETPADFAALGVFRDRVAANLAAMNISAPNALQSACFGPLASGRDAIVQAHTGSGKTIAFLLPLIEQLDASSNEPQALVVSPSRELAFQTARVAEMLLAGTGLSCAWYATQGSNPRLADPRLADPRLAHPRLAHPSLLLTHVRASPRTASRVAPTPTARWTRCARRGRSCWWAPRAASPSSPSSGRSSSCRGRAT